MYIVLLPNCECHSNKLSFERRCRFAKSNRPCFDSKDEALRSIPTDIAENNFALKASNKCVILSKAFKQFFLLMYAYLFLDMDFQTLFRTREKNKENINRHISWTSFWSVR